MACRYYWDDKLQTKIYTEDNGDKLIEMDEIKLLNKASFQQPVRQKLFRFSK